LTGDSRSQRRLRCRVGQMKNSQDPERGVQFDDDEWVRSGVPQRRP